MPQFSTADVITSGSLRRLRGSHYSAQRAHLSQDALPLIPKDRRLRSEFEARPRSVPLPVPYPPQPTYQPHQLIAVCFNHMAGRECEHCRQLDQGLRSQERVDEGAGSDETLGQQNGNRYSGSEQSGSGNDGGEKGESSGPPTPVNIFDKRLSKLRLQVLGLWGRTGTSTLLYASVTIQLTLWQS